MRWEGRDESLVIEDEEGIMHLVRFVWEAITGLPQYYRTNKIVFFLTISMALIMAVYHLNYAFKLCSGIRNPVYKVLIFVAEALGSIAIMVSAIVFNHAGEIATLKPEMLSRGFFLEIIGVTIIYLLFYGYAIYRAAYADSNQNSSMDASEKAEKDAELANKFIQGVVIVIVSVLFLFIGTGFVTAGPVIFKKTLGNWGFSIYAGWATSIILTFFAGVIELPLIWLVGNRNNAFLDDFDKNIDIYLGYVIGVMMWVAVILFACHVN